MCKDGARVATGYAQNGHQATYSDRPYAMDGSS